MYWEQEEQRVTSYDRHIAEGDWDHARRKLLYQEVVCFIKECSVDLYSFEEIQSTLNLKQKVSLGLQEIPLARIRGSVGRYNDFTSAFLPKKKHMRDRWVGIDLAMKEGITPPIEVYQVGEFYFVMDGNHRVSIARESGYETIEAEVWDFPTPLSQDDEEMVYEELLEGERFAFLEMASGENRSAAEQISFTRPGSYDQLVRHIEIYRQGMQQLKNRKFMFQAIFPTWLAEVYDPSVKAIRKFDFLSMFPSRTESDLFIWTWQNRNDLEMLEMDGSQSDFSS